MLMIYVYGHRIATGRAWVKESIVNRFVIAAALLLPAVPSGAEAAPAFSCGGAAMLGGAQLVCSHIDAAAPTQICTFSWTLMNATAGQTVVSGSFMLAPGITNATEYQGSGFSYALSNPIVLCQGSKVAR